MKIKCEKSVNRKTFHVETYFVVTNVKEEFLCYNRGQDFFCNEIRYARMYKNKKYAEKKAKEHNSSVRPLKINWRFS